MVKGNQREDRDNNGKFVGFTTVVVKAINPTREELNKLLGTQSEEEKPEFEYLSTDGDGNKRVRLSFWLHDEERNKYFVYSFLVTNKIEASKDGQKFRFLNSTCNTTWGDEEKNLPEWFRKFTSKKDTDGNYDVLGDKVVRKALLGENDLQTILRSWLGRLTWTDTNCEVLIDTNKLFSGNYGELRELIEGSYNSPFIILVGVRTDKEDSTKQYQQVCGKAFLPKDMMKYIQKGNKFPSDYAKRIWDKFEKEVTGDYGFSAYFELVPLTDYDSTKDIAVSETTKKDAVTNTNSRY